MEEKETKGVTLGQMIGSIVTISLAIFIGWNNLKTDVSTFIEKQANDHERIEKIEAAQSKQDEKREKDMKDIMDTLLEIKLTIERKKDK